MIKRLFRKKNKKINPLENYVYKNSIAKQAEKYKSNPITESYNKNEKITFEKAFGKVFNRTDALKARKPKDIEQFQLELLLYSEGKLSPNIIVEKYGFKSRAFFTSNIIWGFLLYEIDYRTDHMRRVGKVPEWMEIYDNKKVGR